MRLAAIASALAIVLCVAVFGAILFQDRSVSRRSSAPAAVASVEGQASGTAVTGAESAAAQAPAATRAPTVVAQSSPPSPWPAFSPPSCSNPNALGIARVVDIDTTGGPGFGFEHFKSHDFLQPGEVVLTFDDGPWPRHTPAVLAALAAHCTKAIFFPIGKHAMWEPTILKQVAAAGHAVGSHTWSHTDLSKKGMTFEMAKDEIEKGISAVHWAVGGPTAPYFRFPALKHPPDLVTYLGQRNIGIFST